MQDFERITSFINSFNKDDEGTLGEIYEQARERGIPVIRRETRELLKLLMLMQHPANILEIGTAVGYSALYMSKYASCHSHITTIELDTDRAEEARTNIKRLGMDSVITVLQGDAAEVLPTLSGSFDFAFVDAAKGQYLNYYEEVMRLLAPGGLILSDNVLQDGEILESHFLVTKRDRTIHDRMRDYLYTIKNDSRLETAILSVGDGVALSIRR
jgi:predicted O-methyltransferase YrrM